MRLSSGQPPVLVQLQSDSHTESYFQHQEISHKNWPPCNTALRRARRSVYPVFLTLNILEQIKQITPE